MWRWLAMLLWLLAGSGLLAAPLPHDLEWVDRYPGLKPTTGPSDPAGENDYYISGQPLEVYQVLRDRFKSQGWTVSERTDLPVVTGQGQQRQRIVAYGRFQRGPQHFEMQVVTGAHGFKMLALLWRNWVEAPTPDESP